MPAMDNAASLEEQIGQWRSYLHRRQAIHSVDVAELEDHLREQIAALSAAGLAADEAFLIAVKRMGDLDTLSREFAREHSERLWKQLVSPSDTGAPQAAALSRGRAPLRGHVAEPGEAVQQRVEHPVGPLQLSAGELIDALLDGVSVALALVEDGQDEGQR